MFEKIRNSSKSGRHWIDYWIHDPHDEETSTIFFLPGVFTTGKFYLDRVMPPLVEEGYRIILPEPHLTKRPIQTVDEYVNLFMTLYHRLTIDEHMDFTRHRFIGYSLGSLAAAILAADDGNSHTPAESFVSISPVVPGQEFDFKYYERHFLDMGTRLQFGREGWSGAKFALAHGIPFMTRAYSNRERSRRLLKSINDIELEKPVKVPTLAIFCEEDEFFPPEISIPYYEENCTDLEAYTVEETSHSEILHHPQDIMGRVLDFYARLG